MSWRQEAKERCEKAEKEDWTSHPADGVFFAICAQTDLPRALDLLERALPYLKKAVDPDDLWKPSVDETVAAQKLIEEIEG